MIADVLRTKRLVLRPFTLGDVEAVFDYSSDAAWARYQTTPHPYSMPEAEQFVSDLIRRDRESRPAWAITIDDLAIGIVSLVFEADYRVAVLGYGIHRANWGLGLTGEAVATVLDRSFACYSGLSKIRAHTDARNVPSIALLMKLGFWHEGTLRENQFAKGECVDEAIYGLLRREWKITGAKK